MAASHVQQPAEPDSEQHAIVLSTLNARYIHSAFGLRYLKANLGEIENQCVIEEFTLESRPVDVVEKLLAYQPKVIGFGVYIWNVAQTEQVLALLKAVAPEVTVVLGGPEVSYEYQEQNIVALADYLITGWGDISFASLAKELLQDNKPQLEKVIVGEQPKLDVICMPYHLYSDEDIRNRVLYVEASRGCPFKCEFCLSAPDKTAWPFDLDTFLQQMDELHQRGARHFKFVDRTFNLKVKNSARILEFFLQRLDDDLFLHFELIPDHLPETLKELIARFPANSLQFEIGVQSFNSEVQARISRHQDNEKTEQNIRWIRQHSQAHIHTDLIFGLPGETLESFAEGFDRLYALQPHEIQVGILKRLKGSPIVRHTQAYDLRFDPNPPFAIVGNSTADYSTVQQMQRFARYWDLIGNSGHFKHSLPVILQATPFSRFWQLSAQLYARAQRTHKISLLRLYDLVFDIVVEALNCEADVLKTAIEADFTHSGLKSTPNCLQATDKLNQQLEFGGGRRKHNARQAKH